jgi:hypothetical protein
MQGVTSCLTRFGRGLYVPTESMATRATTVVKVFILSATVPQGAKECGIK